MSHIHMFFNFIRANCKRLLHYLPSMFVSLLLLLLLTGTAGFYLSRHLYKENVFSAISIGYYLPQDDNLDLNQLGIGMLQDLEGMEETVQLVQVNSVEEGYNMLASHEILYLIIVPSSFSLELWTVQMYRLISLFTTTAPYPLISSTNCSCPTPDCSELLRLVFTAALTRHVPTNLHRNRYVSFPTV